MNQKPLITAALLFGGCQVVPDTHQTSTTELARVDRTTVLFGQRQMDEIDWAPVEDQFLIGAEHSSVASDSGLGPEFGFTTSFASEAQGSVTLDASLLEVYAGGRVQSMGGDTRPFIGGGVAITYGRVEASSGFASNSESDVVFGFYIHGGVSFRVSEKMDLVFDVRKRVGDDAEINGFEIDADYLTIAVGLSF